MMSPSSPRMRTMHVALPMVIFASRNVASREKLFPGDLLQIALTSSGFTWHAEHVQRKC